MNGGAYYNEHDPFAAAWLGELITDGAIAPGHVDERDIREVQPRDLAGFVQCHFFAGIGGWSYALRLAGWDDARPVWTGSCPCQPFSAAGKGKGFDDTRHLWPAWFRLIRERRPPIVFGEQVASPAGLAWFDTVSTDLEAEAYAVGAADLSAASVGAPHIRQRLFFVADRESEGPSHQGSWRLLPESREGCDARSLADTRRTGDERGRGRGSAHGEARGTEGEARQRERGGAHPGSRGSDGSVGDAAGDGRERSGLTEHSDEQRPSWTEPDGSSSRRPWDGASLLAHTKRDGRGPDEQERGQKGRGPDGGGASAWSGLVWLPCRDGKARPTQPGLQPLAHGVPNRVGTLRGAGNAIVPQVAAEFIAAYLETP